MLGKIKSVALAFIDMCVLIVVKYCLVAIIALK